MFNWLWSLVDRNNNNYLNQIYLLYFQKKKKQFNDSKIDTKQGNKIKKTKQSNKEIEEHNKNNNKFTGMQNISIRVERAISAKAQDSSNHQHDSSNQQRPPHLFSKSNTTLVKYNFFALTKRASIKVPNLLLIHSNNFLFTYSCEITNIQNISSRSASSEEDNSPTELNNCRRLIDKPPLVYTHNFGHFYL